jgi:branched-chain amino acid aminotransferase
MYLFSNEKAEISAVPPRISFLDHGFLFGDSVYEVLRLYDGRVFAEADHWNRLLASGARLKISVESFQQDIFERARALFKQLAEPNACLRIIITRGEGPLHIDPRPCRAPQIFMAAWKYDSTMRAESLDVFVTSIRRNSRFSTDPAIKSGNYLNSILAFREAVDHGFDDALMLNGEGFVTEFTTSNIGWIREGKIYTPSTNCGILHGVTRKHFLNTVQVREGEFQLQHLMEADEVFALSTLKELVPIRKVKSVTGEEREWNFFGQSQDLHARLKESIENELRKQERIF